MATSWTRPLIAVIVSVLLTSQLAAQPGPQPIESIDIRVLRASTIFVGTIVDYPDERDDYFLRVVTFEVSETLKGGHNERFKAKLPYLNEMLDRLKNEQTRLLLFVNSADDLRANFINLDEVDIVVSKLDFTLIYGTEPLLKYVREVVREYPSVNYIHGFRMQPPETDVGAIWKRQFERPGVAGLYVPVDERLHERAKQWILSEDADERYLGVQALYEYESAETIEIMKSMLGDPSEVPRTAAASNRGIEVREYNVRRLAWQILKNWGVEVGEPQLYVEEPKHEQLEKLLWQGPITSDDYQTLEQFSNLKTLTLWGTPLTGEHLEVITQLDTVTELGISYGDIHDGDIWYLSQLPNLTRLSFNIVGVSDLAIGGIAAIKSLQTVTFNETEITDGGIAELRRLRPDLAIELTQTPSIINHYANRGDIAGIRRILDNNPAARDQEDRFGYTAMQLATLRQNVDILKLFLRRGASIDTENSEGQTPLHIARTVSIAKTLIGLGANVNHKDKNGNTPLHIALNKSRGSDFTRFLLANGADPFAMNHEGQLPLGRLANTFQQHRDEIEQYMSMVKDVAPFGPPALQTSVVCENNIYSLQPDDDIARNWATEAHGKFFGRLGWTKTPSGRDFLGPFGQQAVVLKLDGLREHENVRIEIDLFIMGSWDGNGDGAGPDIIDVRIPGVGMLLHTSFFNNTEGDRAGLPLQSFPDRYGLGYHTGYQGAAEVKTLGYVERYPRNAVYTLSFTIAHSGADLEIEISGFTVPQSYVKTLLEDEIWGIGGLRVFTD
ncbi:MAG: ankyrin repeat domain-containing protein [Armatimonadetes bacterium]|nr:ankyrin repeat domain-containing protein [Armatimonadota bacterium]